MKAKATDAEFIAAWQRHKSATEVGKALGMHVRNVHNRRRHIESTKGIALLSDDSRTDHFYKHIQRQHPAKHPLEVGSGTVVVFSDAHFWPGVRTTAFRGLLNLIRQLKPVAVINNGDAFDGASISRHPRIGWDSKPTVMEELKCCKERLEEVQDAAGNAKLFWPMGNHDARFETFLAANAPQFEKVKGFRLKDHMPAWIPCWSVWVNSDLVVKHRYKGGIHATHNNTVNAGTSMVTGHLHSLKVTPFTDYTGTRYGVDTGTLAEPSGPQFEDYMETNPANWRSGFAVLTFHNGRLLWPELAPVWEFDQIQFRGDIINVSRE
jgi:hypothetical protein